MRPLSQLPHEPLGVDHKVMGHGDILETRALLWPDESACAATACAMAANNALRNANIELVGPLGAGKTTFVRHLLRALGVQGRVKSPTYTVVEPYELPGLDISHFDFYRFNDPREWVDAGFRDTYGKPGLKLAEWPDKAAGLLPTPDLRLHIAPIDEHQRNVRLEAFTPCGMALLA